MAVARLETPPPPGGAVSSALGLTRDRGERELLALRRAGVLSPEQVRAVQHGFLLEAMTEAVADLGYANTSANEVVRRARVSRQTFYDLFKTGDECFLAALQVGHDHVLDAARIGYRETKGPWEARIRGAVTEILALLDAQADLAELVVVQALAGPRAGIAAHRQLVMGLATDVGDTARQAGPRASVPDLVTQALVSGAWMTVHDRLTAQPPSRVPLVSLAGDLAYMLCGPFLSAKDAARQRHASSRAPARDWSAAAQATPADQGLERHGSGARKQLLRYLAAHGGASNLMVAEHLGATQSTTSRRLAALAKDRLIVSTKRGGRHSWHVTEQGHAALAGPA